MAIYTLPDLPYDYSALEPAISGKIMELHHDKHHAAYVTGANTALDKLAEAREKGDFGYVNQLEKDLAFNLGGNANHTAFWKMMGSASDTPERPSGELAAAIDEYFGSFEAFQKHFTAAATGIQGSGWAVLAWDTISQRPVIFQLFDQQSNVPVAQIPLLMLDMWEHAFYLDYLNVKADYVKAWWSVVNWAEVEARFEVATKHHEVF